jgi:hypothetical protein
LEITTMIARRRVGRLPLCRAEVRASFRTTAFGSVVFASLALAAFLSPAAARAEIPTADAPTADTARLAPDTTVLYSEVTRLDPLVDLALAPATQRSLAGLEPYQKYLESKEYQRLMMGIGLLEARLGTDWRSLVRDLSGGVSICFDPATQSGFVALRARQPGLLEKLHVALSDFVAAEAEKRGAPSPVKSEEYRGITGWSFGPQECHIILGDLLVISNKPDALKRVIDRHIDPLVPSLAGKPEFNEARGKRPADAVAWSWADLAALRQDANIQKALSPPATNPPAELLFAGVGDALRQAVYATSTVQIEGQAVRLRTEVPFDASQRSSSRSWFYATAAGDAAVSVPGMIGSFAMFRDLAGLWAARDELFDEATAAKFAQNDSQLGLFFSGRDFGPEVLGELAAPLQFVVARQEFLAGQPVPALKLPAFALILKLKHPDDFAQELLLTYQKVIGFGNIIGGQQGQPQLLLGTEDYHGAAISKATYLASPKLDKQQAPVNYNFSPACVRVGDHFVFASTVGIARQVVDSLQNAAAEPLTGNLSLTIEAAPLAAILADNLELLITQNMLSDGHSRAEAEAALDTVLTIVRSFDRLAVRLLETPGTLAWETTLTFKQP